MQINLLGDEGWTERTRSDEPARVLLVSNFAMPRAAVQEDAGKVMVRWGDGADERLWFRREDAVDYWDGVD